MVEKVLDVDGARGRQVTYMILYEAYSIRFCDTDKGRPMKHLDDALTAHVQK
jgi:hypothetical protein